MNQTYRTIESKNIFLRVKSMLKLDFYRLFHTPALYIMLVIAAIIPALLLTMPGEGESTSSISNVWMLVESLGTSQANPMDFAGYANINMVFIFAGLLMAIFISHDYSSGFVKNIFTVHSKKYDYVISKSIVGMTSGIAMIITYILGTIISGLIMGVSFKVGILGLVSCLLSKALLMAIFSSLFVAIAVFFKQKLWITIVFTFLFGMMLYPLGSIANLSANFSTVLIALVLGAIGAILIGSISSLILNKRDLL